jgi:hypothetical protein
VGNVMVEVVTSLKDSNSKTRDVATELFLEMVREQVLLILVR